MAIFNLHTRKYLANGKLYGYGYQGLKWVRNGGGMVVMASAEREPISVSRSGAVRSRAELILGALKLKGFLGRPER